jgi:hypothetical protein
MIIHAETSTDVFLKKIGLCWIHNFGTLKYDILEVCLGLVKRNTIYSFIVNLKLL